MGGYCHTHQESPGSPGSVGHRGVYKREVGNTLHSDIWNSMPAQVQPKTSGTVSTPVTLYLNLYTLCVCERTLVSSGTRILRQKERFQPGNEFNQRQVHEKLLDVSLRLLSLTGQRVRVALITREC